MRCAYFDCFSGAAGDMLLGALLAAGWRLDDLREIVHRLQLPGVDVTAEPVRKSGFAATHVHVHVPPEAQRKHRHLPQINAIIQQAGLAPPVTERALRVFARLGAAEAAVHGVPLEKVHFHEVGAADAIVDIVGVCAGLSALGVERIVSSPLPTGTGTVRCEHGLMPVPAPATAELLKGVPLAACDEPTEILTPTGAALLTTLADEFGPLPAFRIQAIGCGAGTRELQTRPNIVRVLLGELAATPHDAADTVVVLETEVDDATGQVIAHALRAALQAGALDAYATPVLMKKGRPGHLLTVLARAQDAAALENVLFAETPTFGIRRHVCTRTVLAREHQTVATPYGAIRVKIGRRAGETAALQAWPEYEDCAAAAQAHHVALRVVQDAARSAWLGARTG